MGSQQQFCLRWNNHQSNLLSVFDDLLQHETLVDVTLACDGVSMKAHKVVLSACSPYFQRLFQENPCKHPIVILKDIRYADMKTLVDFMYKGEVNVSHDQLSTLLRVADTLKVKGLAEVTEGMATTHQQREDNGEIPDDVVTIPSGVGGVCLDRDDLPIRRPAPSGSPPASKRRKRRRGSGGGSAHSDDSDVDSHGGGGGGAIMPVGRSIDTNGGDSQAGASGGGGGGIGGGVGTSSSTSVSSRKTMLSSSTTEVEIPTDMPIFPKAEIIDDDYVDDSMASNESGRHRFQAETAASSSSASKSRIAKHHTTAPPTSSRVTDTTKDIVQLFGSASNQDSLSAADITDLPFTQHLHIEPIASTSSTLTSELQMIAGPSTSHGTNVSETSMYFGPSTSNTSLSLLSDTGQQGSSGIVSNAANSQGPMDDDGGSSGFSYITSMQGSRMLVYDTFVFYMKRPRKDGGMDYCCRHRGCYAAVSVHGQGHLISASGVHRHPNDAELIARRKWEEWRYGRPKSLRMTARQQAQMAAAAANVVQQRLPHVVVTATPPSQRQPADVLVQSIPSRPVLTILPEPIRSLP